jgi:peptidoglycan biosynthesis protein MviN/MurJ (putative lipid II flippase)
MHADHRRIASGAARVAFFLLLGKFAGAAKEMAVAYRYGISDIVDAYQFTMTLAAWLPVTLVGVLSVVLIPVLVRIQGKEHTDRIRFLSELQGWTVLVGCVLAALVYVAWPLVLQRFGQGLSQPVQAMSQTLTFAFAPAAFLTLLTGISAARLRAHERHVNTLLDSVPAVVILAAVMLAGSQPSVGPLLWGTLAGYVLQSAWLLWLANRADQVWVGPRFSLHSQQWPHLAKAAGIMLIGQVAMSLVAPIDQYTAANLGGNANATLGYANRLLSLVLGLGAASVGRAALPVLADVYARGDHIQARRMAIQWSVWMLLAGAVAVLAGWLLAPWGVSLLFERGQFTAADTLVVAQTLRWGLLQLPFYFGVLILVQLLASQHRYAIMAGIALANFGLKALLNPLLAPAFGLKGLLLATAGMYALSYACYVVAALRTHVPGQRV